MSKRKAAVQKSGKTVKKRKTGGSMTATVPRNMNFQRNTVGLGPEKKNCDVSYNIGGLASGTAWVTPAAGALLNSIPQGNDETSRVGRKVQMKSIDIHYTFGLQPTSTGGGCVRWKVIYDKQPNSALFATLAHVAFDDFGSKNNLANSDRFITLIDEISEPLGIGTNYSVSGRIYRKLGLDTIFTGNGGAIANITTGSVFVVVCNNGYINTTGPLYEFDSRIRFIDI